MSDKSTDKIEQPMWARPEKTEDVLGAILARALSGPDHEQMEREFRANVASMATRLAPLVLRVHAIMDDVREIGRDFSPRGFDQIAFRLQDVEHWMVDMISTAERLESGETDSLHAASQQYREYPNRTDAEETNEERVSGE